MRIEQLRKEMVKYTSTKKLQAIKAGIRHDFDKDCWHNFFTVYFVAVLEKAIDYFEEKKNPDKALKDLEEGIKILKKNIEHIELWINGIKEIHQGRTDRDSEKLH